ncbi:VWA domain-containing protein [Paenibacillus senegalensis]|uniref:VWA domain-containing protein n=1 Tax=Paenibacillus senegalensis TaxID=1465766 RepID=UPI0002894AB1|nr:VWA domain-containing protein [Paenibacillus senegalensis]
MSGNVPIYPFCAVVEQQAAKQALLLHAVNPKLGGVLLSGHSGTAKSTLVRGLAELLPDKTTVAIPLHATEDRLLGGMDAAHAIRHGNRKLSAGLLHEANGNIVIIDEAHLMPKARLKLVLQAMEAGSYALEREGLSAQLDSRFLLFGTMNPEEASLIGAYEDHWGLIVQMDGIYDLNDRKEIVRRRLEYEREPDAFVRRYEAQTEVLKARIQQAQQLIPQLEPDDSVLRLASEIVRQAGCSGHRRDIRIVETARALAAWEGETVIRPEHVRRAAESVLPSGIMPEHGEHNPVSASQERPPEQSRSAHQSEQQAASHPESSGRTPENRADAQPGSTSPDSHPLRTNQLDVGDDNDKGEASFAAPTRLSPETLSAASNEAKQEKQVEAVGQPLAIPSLSFNRSTMPAYGRAGRRSKIDTSSGQGRYIRAEIPKGAVRDLALDATLRAAAPYQKIRREKRLHAGTAAKTKLIIERSDLRIKVREQRIGTALWFVVDASGSMNASRRMRAVKGAVLSLLKDAYQKRDRVGFITFRGSRADVLLEMTRSVEKAEQKLRLIPTGGKTPLSAGLAKAFENVQADSYSKQKPIPVLVIVTDGRANASLVPESDPWEESRRIAHMIASLGIQSLVIDTEQGFVRLGYARKLADELQAQYVRLEQLEAGEIKRAVRNRVLTGESSRY